MNVDVLVVGGGIQGLLILKFLKEKGYSAVIVTEKDIGDGQTLHGHGWLHGGYLFPNPVIASNMQNHFQFWKKEFEKHSIELDVANKFLVLPEQMVASYTSVYEKLSFPFKEIAKSEIPQALKNSSLFSGTERVFQIQDGEFRPDLVVKALATPLLDDIITGELVSLDIDESKSAEVASIKLQDGRNITIKPRFVIFATGAATIKAAEKINSKNSEDKEKILKEAQELQNCKQVVMLCIRGPEDILPSVGMMHLPLKLFAVGRSHQPFEDLSGEKRSIFFVTLLNPTNFKGAVEGEAEAPIDSEILRTTTAAFFKLFPSLEEKANALEFSIYFGYRQSSASGEKEHAEKFAGLQNVVFALPSVITLSKAAADRAVSIVESELKAPKVSTVEVEEFLKSLKQGKPLSKIGKLKFDKIEWSNWNQFKQLHKL